MADLRDILQTHLVDEKAGWSMGSFGAIAEFHQDKGEYLEADAPALFVRATRRGAIRLNAATVDRIEPVAYETLSPKPHRWSHAVALCLPHREAAGNRRDTLTELGPDEDAVRPADRRAILFDMGLGLPQCDFCIRTADPDLLAILRENAGRSLFDPANPAGGAILKAHPHRVALTRIGRVEVFQKIGGPDTGGVSPPGPHTHLLPQLLKAKRTHSANTPIPDHLVPLGYLHPANPVMDGMGADTDFDIDAHARFQGLYDQFARPDLPLLRKAVLEALGRKVEPDDFIAPSDRFGRAALRLTLRQQHRLAEKFSGSTYCELVARWRAVFDKASDTTAADDDAPGH
ncbi:hypothetical protein KYK30_19830 [Shinella yambaruensis]|uniref:Uncharacterized protein n=1 Tax=Shinella yambaruensis TaxID=415996 RepID=A0ABQ5ZPK3_9HYPH|nr:hypothetical protein [Shinella yambaruensis]MCJ8028895.1 hypothetical protein [Shinella yambaruensis]MCU7981951.1 hypothetical protein [Shinella yambaruensis]GLR54794.1 hypothetical protein GCM10007923_60130 [Shinella yambaruensis]